MYVIGIDIGGSFTKAAIYNDQGQQIHSAKQQAKLITPKPGWVERDMDVLWSDICVLMQKVTKHVHKNAVKAISITAHGKGLYAVDKQGKPIRNAILSADGRAIDIVSGWYENGIKQKSYEKTLQNLWTGHPASILRWLKEYEPENYHNIGHILMAHDYIRYCLTGEIHVERTNISESNLYNAHIKDFDPALYDLFGIAEMMDKMPPMINSHEYVGCLTEDAALMLGLCQDVRVYGGLFDVVAATLCAGLNSPKQMNTVFGTWNVASIIDRCAKTNSHYDYVWGEHCMKNTKLLHDASPTSASNFEWFVRQFLSHHDNPYDVANSLLKDEDLTTNDILFSPFLFGNNHTLGMQAGFYGLSGHHELKDIIAAIWQGICFAQKTHMDRLLALYPDIKVLRASGGPANSKIWMQMFTDMAGVPVEVIHIEEIGCFGAALCAYIGEGIIKDYPSAIRQYVNQFTQYFPNMRNHEYYQEKYSRYQNWLDQTNG